MPLSLPPRSPHSSHGAEEAEEDETVDLNLANRATLERVGDFFLNGAIDGNTVENLGLAMLRQAMYVAQKRRTSRSTRHFRLTVNSPGGSVESGFMVGHIMARMRREYGITTDVYVGGIAASMGVVLLQFGDRRYVDRFAQVMLHDPALSYSGSVAFNVREFADRSHYLELTRRNMAALMSLRNTAGHNEAAWWLEHYFEGGDHYIDAYQALSDGLADAITDNYVAFTCGAFEETETDATTCTTPAEGELSGLSGQSGLSGERGEPGERGVQPPSEG